MHMHNGDIINQSRDAILYFPTLLLSAKRLLMAPSTIQHNYLPLYMIPARAAHDL